MLSFLAISKAIGREDSVASRGNGEVRRTAHREEHLLLQWCSYRGRKSNECRILNHGWILEEDGRVWWLGGK